MSISQSIQSPIRIVTLTADSSISSATAAAVTGLNTTLNPGTYWFEYYINALTGTTTVSLKFGVNFTGTQTSMMYDLYFPSAGVTAATGAVSQATNVTTGNVWAFHSTRTNNTALGPQTDIDSTGIVMYRITGMIVVTVAGTLQLLHGSESASSTTTKAGTMLLLIKAA